MTDPDRRRRWASMLAFIPQSVVAGLAAAFVIVAMRPDLLAPTGSQIYAAPAPASYADAVERSAPAVVNVYTGIGDPESTTAFDVAVTPSSSSLGSGVIVSDEGHVLTNEHLVRGNASVKVALTDGRVTIATVLGTDPDTDLALLRIDLRPVPVISLGRSSRLRTGDVVLAIGNPFGIGQTVTQGIVSATGRSQLGLSLFENFVQTDAPINPGNSGGALVNVAGDLVGVNTAMFTAGTGFDSEGIGFAIPIDLARGVMRELLEHGRVIRGWLGVHVSPIQPGQEQELGLDVGQEGIYLSSVMPHGPASRAGLRAGDVVLAMDDRPVLTPREALGHVARLTPGSLVRVQVERQGVALEVQARVKERPRGS
ncbi:MAG: trypsin-like peptidase domain-containing protein [Pseudomonadota bacterium]